MIQDVEIPVEKLPEFLDWFDAEIGMRPVWLCPLRLRRGAEQVGARGVLASVLRVEARLGVGIRSLGDYETQLVALLRTDRIREIATALLVTSTARKPLDRPPPRP